MAEGSNGPPGSGRPAVFLDRDGVINENLLGAYIRTWEQFRFLPGVLEAIAALTAAGYPVVVITNQGGIGRGRMTEAELVAIHRQMEAAIANAGGRLAGIHYCPHTDRDGCACRKPRPGMLLQAAETLGLDLAQSVFVGDHLTDAQAALAAGCRAILVRSGRGDFSTDGLAAGLAAEPALADAPIVDDLPAAVGLLLAERVGGNPVRLRESH